MDNRSQPVIFLTGATGAIGSRILEHSLQQGSKVLALVRGRDGVLARERLDAMLDMAKIPATLRRRAGVVEGSITEKRFGLSETDYRRIINSADQFIHSAAVTHLGASAEECERANILGTENALGLAHACRREGCLSRFAYLSSYAASGTARGGYFAEDSLPEQPAFANEYERSKYAAEARVREDMVNGLPVVIFRPSVTVGDTETGRISSFNFFYQVFKVLGTGMLSHWPDLRERTVNIVPVDYVARAIRSGLGKSWSLGKTFHLVSRNGCLLRDLYELTRSFPALRTPRLVPLAQWSLDLLSKKEQVIHSMMEKYLLPYLGDIQLETTNAERLMALPVINLSFLRRLMEYAVEAGYLPRPAPDPEGSPA